MLGVLAGQLGAGGKVRALHIGGPNVRGDVPERLQLGAHAREGRGARSLVAREDVGRAVAGDAAEVGLVRLLVEPGRADEVDLLGVLTSELGAGGKVRALHIGGPHVRGDVPQ